MDRRSFLNWVGVGLLASSLPVAIAACQSSSDSSNQSASDRQDGFQVVGSIEQLNKEGKLEQTLANQPIIVLRDPTTKTTVALNATCPHQGCQVKLDDTGKALTCPCHGSAFALDGKSTKGPAQKDLAVLETKEEGDSLLVKIS
jgi:cytochrome b6-f complex iron-sulfur subunit